MTEKYTIHALDFGAKLIYPPDPAGDLRGEAGEIFDALGFLRLGMGPFGTEFVSLSYRSVLRGMHFQVPSTAPMEKLLLCVRGALVDVLLDLRTGKHITVRLDENRLGYLYVPPTCAHGFYALSSDTVVIYKLAGERVVEAERVIRWDSFGATWPEWPPILSARDAKAPSYADWLADGDL